MSFKLMKVFSAKDMPSNIIEELFDCGMTEATDCMEYEVYGDTTTGTYLKEQGALEEELVIITDMCEV